MNSNPETFAQIGYRVVRAFEACNISFKGEGACCGGGSSKPKKKKLEGKVVCKYVFRIEGMHCGNCVNAVTRAINDIDGAVAKVSLNKKTAIVSCDREIDVLAIEESIRKRGYEVVLME